MSSFFLKILNMSISAGWLVLAVLLLRLILQKAPKWVNGLLWGIVAVRLTCPFTIESVLSLIPSAETIPSDIGLSPTPAISSGISSLNSAVNPVLSQISAPAPGDSINPMQVAIFVGTALWLLGVAVMLLYAAVSYLRLRNRLTTAVQYQGNIYQSENVPAPFVLGIVKPRIYLPFHMDGSTIDHVVCHERTHILRKDHWWKPLGFLLLAIHWFNPLMWLAYILLCRDIELACDEKVIKVLDPQQRADYSQALLSCSIRRRTIAACPLAFGEVGVKARIKSVLHYKKPAFWMVLLAVVICIALAVCFLTDPAPTALSWAKKLSADQISSARVYVNLEYKDLTDDEIQQMAALIRESKGTPIPLPDTLGGTSCFFSITMKDGTSHSFGNDESGYLVIDGRYYRVDEAWLKGWVEQWKKVDTQPLPQGDVITSVDLLNAYFHDGILPADGTSYSFRAGLYAQQAIFSYAAPMDLELTSEGLYIDDHLYRLVSKPEGMNIRFSENAWYFEDVDNVLDRLLSCEEFYYLQAAGGQSSPIAVCELDGVYYFLSFFGNGEVTRVHSIPTSPNSVWGDLE